MKTPEFDKFADEYESNHRKNIRVSGESPEFFAEYKIRDIRKVVGQSNTPKILDFGGGIGGSITPLRTIFPEADIVCLDVSERSLEIAKHRCGDAAKYICFDGKNLPFNDNIFDIILATCVFHHIEHNLHEFFLREFHRLLIPGGRVFVFEHNPLNPLTRRAVNTCEFDENAVLIGGESMKKKIVQAGFSDVKLRYRIFFPHALAFLRPLEHYLYNLPLGAQYYVVGVK